MHMSTPLLVGKGSALIRSRTNGRPHATYAFAAASESGSQRTSDSQSGGAIRSGMLPLSRCLTGRRGKLLSGPGQGRLGAIDARAASGLMQGYICACCEHRCTWAQAACAIDGHRSPMSKRRLWMCICFVNDALDERRQQLQDE